MNSKLSLRWRDHHSALITMLENHLDNSTLSDCVIAAEGQYIKAHKVVLSSCSPYFQLLFTLENEKNPIVVLKDVKFDDLKAVIDFVYRGEVQVFEDQLVTFLETAESLQIKGLGRNNNERFGKRKKDSSGKRSREHSNSPSPEDNSVKRQAFDAEEDEEEEALELVPVLEENQRDGWKNAKREPSTSFHNDVPSTSTSTVRPYNFRSSKSQPSSSQGSAMNIEIAPALPEPSLSAEDCLAETDSVVKTESLSDSEMGQAEEYMDDALSEGGTDSFMRNDMEEMVGGASGGTSHSVDQPLMRSHYTGGPSSQPESTNLATDNSMMASQMANSQDFMLGLGTLDSAASGSVSGGHMSTEPSTSQGEDAVPRPALRPFRRRSVLRPMRHPKLLPPQLPGSLGRNQPEPALRPAIEDSSESLVPLETCTSSFEPDYHPPSSSQSASFASCPIDQSVASSSKDLPVDVSSIKLEDSVLQMVPDAPVMEAKFREPQRIMDPFEFASSVRSGEMESQEVSDKNSEGQFQNSLVQSHILPYFGPSAIAPWPPQQLPAPAPVSYRAGGDLARKKHVCPLCRKVFLKLNYLKVHMRLHTGEKPFRCPMCPASFTQGNALVYHKRTHTGERPYRCEWCDDTFATSSPLHRHRRRVHGVSPALPAARGRGRGRGGGGGGGRAR